MDTSNRRGKILCSAIEIFAEKGKPRATMTEIATKAGVSKSHLYHVYHTKSDLYRVVLEKVIETVFRQLEDVVVASTDDISPVENLVHVATASLDLFYLKPKSAKIVLYSLVNDTDEFLTAARNTMSRAGRETWEAFMALIESAAVRAAAKGRTASDPRSLIAVLVGMNLTYLLGKPIAEVFLDMKVRDEKAFLDAVMRNAVDLWAYGISKDDREATDMGGG